MNEFQSITIKFLVYSLFLTLWSCAGTPPSVPAPENMIRIPAGPFPMGAVIENEHEWGDIDEEPVHEVTLSEYLIDRYEVTAQEFAEFLNAHPNDAERYLETGPAVTIERVEGRYRPGPGLEKHPANRVSWYGADAYCRAQGKRFQIRFRRH
jgi:formylglycine-generating enzyme required for sulfatase activity